jgi:hypothetical protein
VAELSLSVALRSSDAAAQIAPHCAAATAAGWRE